MKRGDNLSLNIFYAHLVHNMWPTVIFKRFQCQYMDIQFNMTPFLDDRISQYW